MGGNGKPPNGHGLRRPGEDPIHPQCFDKPFWIGKTEVTNAQYGSPGYWEGANYPREQVSWFQASSFCASLGLRLPTEAEWEYAVRGPDNLFYTWGNTFVDQNLVFGENSGHRTEEVGIYVGGTSWVGAVDMLGNVYEWTSTIGRPYPYVKSDGREDSSDTTSERVVRGGSWERGRDGIYASLRVFQSPTARNRTTGFRCAGDFSVDEVLDQTTLDAMKLPTVTPTISMLQVHILAGAKLRSGPGSNYPSIGSARIYDYLNLIAKTTVNGETWYLVNNINGQPAWISGTVVEVQPRGETVPDVATIPPPP